jgi:glucarate dehydratase
MNADRIERIDVTPIAFPDPPLLNVAGIHEPLALRTIVQVHTASGLVGLGEAHGGSTLLRSIRSAAEALIGWRSHDIEGARQAASVAVPRGTDRAFAPIEVAMLDVSAQRIGCRVADLLGGAARESAEFAGYLFFKLPQHLGDAQPDAWGEVLTGQQVVALAQRMQHEHGFASWKLKGGVLPIITELSAIHALRRAFPEAPLRLDPNSRWSLEASNAVAERMRGILEYLEDPCEGYAQMTELTGRGVLATATNMLAGSFDASIRAVQERAANVLLLDHHVVGGLQNAVRLAELCAASDIAVSMHSNSHLGVSLAAMTHLSAAVRGDVRANDTHYPWNREYDILEGGPLAITDGAVTLPNGPGLGVRIDKNLLAEAHERYLAGSIRDRDDGSYARRLVPHFGDDDRPWTMERSGWLT